MHENSAQQLHIMHRWVHCRLLQAQHSQHIQSIIQLAGLSNFIAGPSRHQRLALQLLVLLVVLLLLPDLLLHQEGLIHPTLPLHPHLLLLLRVKQHLLLLAAQDLLSRRPVSALLEHQLLLQLTLPLSYMHHVLIHVGPSWPPRCHSSSSSCSIVHIHG